MKIKYVVLVVGPTAVGKTELCVQLAHHLKTEIVSCDSRQFYKELSIGTAKPSADEMGGIVHHFIDSHSVVQHYSAGDYERDALALLAALFEKHDMVIVTGGSGLFVKALTDGLDEMPTAALSIREKLMERLEVEGVDILANELKEKDSAYAETVDLKNSQRVVRALEVIAATGRPFSDFHQKTKQNREFRWIKIGLEREREQLYQRINQRMDVMLENGLIEEVKSLTAFRHHNALQTVGYKEVFDYLDGIYDYTTMVELLKRNSRRYAKRQMTWFKNQDTFAWFSPVEFEKIIDFIKTVRSFE